MKTKRERIEEIIEANKGLIIYYIDKYYRRHLHISGIDRKDLYQFVMAEIYSHCERIDPIELTPERISKITKSALHKVIRSEVRWMKSPPSDPENLKTVRDDQPDSETMMLYSEMLDDLSSATGLEPDLIDGFLLGSKRASDIAKEYDMPIDRIMSLKYAILAAAHAYLTGKI